MTHPPETSTTLETGASAFRLFPLEILGEVMCAVIHNDYLLDKKGRRILTNMECVSKRWREAPRGTTRLWSGLKPKPPLKDEETYNKIVQWLRKAGSTPRTLAVDARKGDGECQHPDNGYTNCPLTDPLFGKLMSESGLTLDHLKLVSGSPNCMRNLLDTMGQSPGLPWSGIRSIHLNFYWAWDENGCERLPPRIFHHLAPITSLSLSLPRNREMFWDLTPSRNAETDIPPSVLARLTTLSIESNWENAGHVLVLIQECDNLENLTVDHGERNDPGLSFRRTKDELVALYSEMPLVLQRLRTLCLKNASNMDILERIHTPNLRTLDIDVDIMRDYDEEDEDDEEVDENDLFTPRFGDFVDRCGGQLRDLTIRNLDIRYSREGLVPALALVPSVERITLDDVNMNQERFWAAMRKASGGPVFPDDEHDSDEEGEEEEVTEDGREDDDDDDEEGRGKGKRTAKRFERSSTSQNDDDDEEQFLPNLKSLNLFNVPDDIPISMPLGFFLGRGGRRCSLNVAYEDVPCSETFEERVGIVGMAREIGVSINIYSDEFRTFDLSRAMAFLAKLQKDPSALPDELCESDDF